MDFKALGHKGGTETKIKLGIYFCPSCGTPHPTDHFKTIGKIGGQVTAMKYSHEHFSTCGAMGGRGNKKNG
jgi:hypothetical protein